MDKLQTDIKDQIVRHIENMHTNYVHHIKADSLILDEDKACIIEMAERNRNQTFDNLDDFGLMAVKDYQIKQIKEIADVRQSIDETLIRLTEINKGLLDGARFEWASKERMGIESSLKRLFDLILADLDTLQVLD